MGPLSKTFAREAFAPLGEVQVFQAFDMSFREYPVEDADLDEALNVATPIPRGRSSAGACLLNRQLVWTGSGKSARSRRQIPSPQRSRT